MTQVNFSTKEKQTHRVVYHSMVVTKGEEEWWRDGLGVWD